MPSHKPVHKHVFLQKLNYDNLTVLGNRDIHYYGHDGGQMCQTLFLRVLLDFCVEFDFSIYLKR